MSVRRPTSPAVLGAVESSLILQERWPFSADLAGQPSPGIALQPSPKLPGISHLGLPWKATRSQQHEANETPDFPLGVLSGLSFRLTTGAATDPRGRPRLPEPQTKNDRAGCNQNIDNI